MTIYVEGLIDLPSNCLFNIIRILRTFPSQFKFHYKHHNIVTDASLTGAEIMIKAMIWIKVSTSGSTMFSNNFHSVLRGNPITL